MCLVGKHTDEVLFMGTRIQSHGEVGGQRYKDTRANVKKSSLKSHTTLKNRIQAKKSRGTKWHVFVVVEIDTQPNI